MTYDLAIIGGGPAGISAGVYAARKKIKTLFLAENLEGQSAVSDDIQNWIGMPHVKGAELAKMMADHLRAYAGDSLDIKKERVTLVEKDGKGFSLRTNKANYSAKTILVATGSVRRKLDIPGAKEFDNKGISYCASCDAPLFDGANVAVVGGGNAAFESAAQLAAYAKRITILARSRFRADPVTVEKVLADKKIEALENIDLAEVKGGDFVTSLAYTKRDSGAKKEIPVTGIFVEIGAVPSVDFVKNLVKLDGKNEIVTDPKTQVTSAEGIWAAGDCTNGLYKQNNIAAGDAVKALENIFEYLKT
ncbi:MAG: FAD-dependent oxidoreductase [Patescibacteria group bacterium]|nr:FAD-dependent oxidoreductase [Patescibacteria group bacterium]MDE1946063.1 FAD-dependent oxidoreductase [Patescibacteria group bacterium]